MDAEQVAEGMKQGQETRLDENTNPGYKAMDNEKPR